MASLEQYVKFLVTSTVQDDISGHDDFSGHGSVANQTRVSSISLFIKIVVFWEKVNKIDGYHNNIAPVRKPFKVVFHMLEFMYNEKYSTITIIKNIK